MPIKTLMTAQEFAETGPETDGFELVRGELSPMPPPKGKHGAVCSKVVYRLMQYVESVGRGTVLCNDTGLITELGPDTVRGVDVMVYMSPSWVGKEIPLDYIKEAPDLAVEVRSPDQSWKQVLEKVAEYLRMGVPLVWALDPKTERAHVFQPHQEPQVLAGDNDLDGGDVLPGFRCKVADLFAV